MPVEEAKTTTDAAAPQADAKKGGKNKLILFGAIGGGAVIIGVVLALFVVKPMFSGKSNKSSDKTAATAEKKEESASKSEASGEGEHGGEAGKSSIYTVKDIVVNPAGTGGSRYLSASIALQLASPEEVAKCQELEPIIRDALITILSSKSVAQLTDPREKEIARLQIKNRVSQLLKGTQLAGVYYTDFVLQ